MTASQVLRIAEPTMFGQGGSINEWYGREWDRFRGEGNLMGKIFRGAVSHAGCYLSRPWS